MKELIKVGKNYRWRNEPMGSQQGQMPNHSTGKKPLIQAGPIRVLAGSSSVEKDLRPW